jgi:hypothetical protein
VSAQHTPGTWYADAHPSGLRILTDDARSTIICQQIGPASNAQARANARLIAAAPELLEALQVFAERSSSEEFITITVRSAYVRRARAAIAKATGEQA